MSCATESFLDANSVNSRRLVSAASTSKATLEKLRSRKSKLISHLQSERSGQGNGQLSHSNLDRVLGTCPHPVFDQLASSVNDTLVAMRTTNSLEDLELGMLVKGAGSSESFSHLGKPGIPQAKHICTGNPSVRHTCIRQVPGKSEVLRSSQGQQSSSADVSEDGVSTTEIDKEVMGIVTAALEDEDESFIPFDPPLVSKFGPICRSARIKGRNTAPVQVTADENMKKCTPVLSVTPLHRPYPTSAPVPSLFKPQMSACPAPTILTAALQPPSAAAIYSPWSGLDFWRWHIPEMVHSLETSAIQANTTSERLALQLQSVELQISMKTGENPKPVSQLLQEAAPSDIDQRNAATNMLRNLYFSGEEAIQMRHIADFPTGLSDEIEGLQLLPAASLS